MIRFIDLGKQIALDEEDSKHPRQFAFYNTTSDRFIEIDGIQVFDSWEEIERIISFSESSDEKFLTRLKNLCPCWVFQKESGK